MKTSELIKLLIDKMSSAGDNDIREFSLVEQKTPIPKYTIDIIYFTDKE
jgi:hypothetical protein